MKLWNLPILKKMLEKTSQLLSWEQPYIISRIESTCSQTSDDEIEIDRSVCSKALPKLLYEQVSPPSKST